MTLTHALILTAGLGTRLRPLTLVRAKPAIPVAGVPMIVRIVGWLADSGVRDLVMNLHHLPETLTAVVGDGAEFGVRVRYSWEQPAVLGSAGGPRQALDIVGAERFVVVNGDTMTDLDLPALVASHERHDALVTMAVTPNPAPDRYSGLRVAADGAVLGVVPRGAGPSHHFVGVQVVQREAFAGVPAGTFASSVGDVYDRLIAARPGRVRAHVCAARFWDIGTVADYWTTCHEFAAAPGSLLAASAAVHPSAHVVDCIAWDGVQIGDGCELTRCIVTDGVRVAPGSVHRDAILMRGAAGDTVACWFEAQRHE